MKKSKKELNDRDKVIAKVFKTNYVQTKLNALCDEMGINTDHVLRKDCKLYTEDGNLIPEVSEMVNNYLMINEILKQLKSINEDLYEKFKDYTVDIKAVDSVIEFLYNVKNDKTNKGNLFQENCPDVAKIFIK